MCVHNLCLRRLVQVLSTVDGALLGTPPFSETSRALHQLHDQAIQMVHDVLSILTSVGEGVGADLMDNVDLGTNKEFLDFLEIQSKTQVKILEVEVKAGQELMRLLKAQHKQEQMNVRYCFRVCVT